MPEPKTVATAHVPHIAIPPDRVEAAVAAVDVFKRFALSKMQGPEVAYLRSQVRAHGRDRARLEGSVIGRLAIWWVGLPTRQITPLDYSSDVRRAADTALRQIREVYHG